jgi:hypothetical protein
MVVPRTQLFACALCGVLSLVLSFVAGCSASTPSLETVTELPQEPRRPAGVAVDPVSNLPEARSSGAAEQGLVVLRSPRDISAARLTVRRFFDAVVAGSADAVDELIDEEAWVQTGTQGNRQRARDFWRLRLSRLDYGALTGHSLYRDGEVETYRAADLEHLGPRRVPPLAVQGDDVLVRVPIATQQLGRMRMFGDEIVFLLRPDGERYEIAEMFEDFRLP